MKTTKDEIYRKNIYAIKKTLIEQKGEKYYYELIGDRIHFIVNAREDVRVEMERATEFVKNVIGLTDIDENGAFREFILNQVVKIVDRDEENPSTELMAMEVALMDLAFDVYEKLES